MKLKEAQIKIEKLRLEKENIMLRWNFIVLIYIGLIPCTIVIWATFVNSFKSPNIQISYTITIILCLIIFTIITLKKFLYNKIVRLEEINKNIIKQLKK
ncbi:MAG: hypothetical protein ABFQ65_03560 [Nanoarchaeota archaeon]